MRRFFALLLLCAAASGCKHEIAPRLPEAPPVPGISDKDVAAILRVIKADMETAPLVPAALYLAVLKDVIKLQNETADAGTWPDDNDQLITDLQSLRWAVTEESRWVAV